ncbi:MFS transporter [Vibrio ostreicida]|uniref:MFS transporter n=1 Tax=Vibrio ostreicida TaxID=526588 RepID=A0ABT8BXD0_9VIBR|nr:MFS transporter [Vibrio ostreicida]MDN3611308.1 MFS transporter [Vibrio ostreicida]NPD09250.1 MFS transporter [Vibrio ostreicida]
MKSISLKDRLGLISSLLADQVIMFLIPIIVFNQTNSFFYSGVAYAIEWIPRVIIIPFSGYFIDKFGEGVVLKISRGVRSVTIAIISSSLYVEYSLSPLILGLLGSLISISNGQSILSFETYSSKTLDGNELSEEHARIFRLDQISLFISPLLSFALMELASFSFFDVSMFAIVLLGLSFLCMERLDFKNDNEKNKKVSHFFKESISEILSNKVLMLFCLVSMSNNFISGVVEASAPGLIVENYKLGEGFFSMVMVIPSLFGIAFLSIIPVMNKSIGRIGAYSFASFMMVVFSLTTFLSSGFHWYIMSYSMSIGFVLIVGNYIRSRRGEIIAKKNMGGTIAVMSSINAISLPLSGFAVSYFSELSTNFIWLIIPPSIVLIVCIPLVGRFHKDDLNRRALADSL